MILLIVHLLVFREFDTHAKNIIDECYKKDQELAIGILDQPAVAFYRCKPLDVARRADCRSFLASETVKKSLDRTWYHMFDERRRILFMPIHVWVSSLHVIVHSMQDTFLMSRLSLYRCCCL